MADSGGEKDELKKSIKCSWTNNVNEINSLPKSGSQSVSNSISKSQYCDKLQEWMWQYYCGYVNWHSCATVFPFPACFPTHTESRNLEAFNQDVQAWVRLMHSVSFPGIPVPNAAITAASTAGERQSHTTPVRQHAQHNGNAQQPGREYFIPSPLHRFMAETVDFFILFFIKATIILSIMHLSGMKDISKFAMHIIVEEIDDDTSMEELQKMMLVALVYRMLVCFYEIICIWGAGGATPGKFMLGLRVVTCDTSTLVQPNRVRVVPATNVSLSASTIRALNKNFSIAFFFPAFITLLFFQHNRTVYDIMAGTIVVKRNRLR